MIDPELLLAAYASGWFPMAVAGGEIRWFSPDPRGILPLESFHVPARLARVRRQGRFVETVDRDFAAVIRACATVVRDQGEPGTWISEDIIAAYRELHERGAAHSVETWEGDELVGGLYGVALGGAFFGESMFHRRTDASKVALAALVERLRGRGFILLDTQWLTPHLARFGGREVTRREYLRRLNRALALRCRFP
jgi:leucyl/phenylalanyl-tRNA---protein transferase